jgi:hypothetical protein
MAQHKNLTGVDLHEPKGLAEVSNAGYVYSSDGLGSGSWTGDITPATLELQTNVYRCITTNYNAMYPAGGSGNAGYSQWNDDGSGSHGVYAAAFDKATEEHLFFDVDMPSDYVEGTDITAYLVFSVPDSNAGNIVWELEYCAVDDGAVSSNTTKIEETAAAPEAAKKPKRIEFSTPISGTNLIVHSGLAFHVSRIANDGSDTYDADAYLHSVKLVYEANVLGTAGKLT